MKYDSLEKLVRKYYRGENKQASLIAMVNGKIDNLHRIEDMLSTYSDLYLYDVAANPELELQTDYLLEKVVPMTVRLIYISKKITA